MPAKSLWLYATALLVLLYASAACARACTTLASISSG